MKKKTLPIILLIVVMLFASLMVACGNGDELAADADKTTVAAQEESKAEETSEESKAEETADDAAKATSKKSSKATEAKKSTEATKAKTSSSKNEESKSTSKESTKEPTKATTAATKATEAAKVCYITVEGHCSSKQVEIKGGESVYDVLKATGASISARSTGYGIYVEGINGRFEFDEGPTSGWVYTVNGSRINVSCSSYEVNSGDKIVWKYVTE